MPSLRKTSAGSFVICFRYDGRQYQRSLKTKDAAEAKAAKGRTEDRLFRLTNGRIRVPAGIDPGDFVVRGKAACKRREQSRRPLCVQELIDVYLEAQCGLKDDSSLRTERTHLRNLTKCLGRKSRQTVRNLHHSDLDAVLQKRLKVAKSTTVQKERQTLVSLFAWAVRAGHLSASPARQLPAILSSSHRPPFRTRGEVEEIVSRGGLSDDEVLELWKCLYLDQAQVGKILALAKQRGKQDFVYPMMVIAAYTGMRRGEILRLRWRDVDFNRRVLTAFSKKQSRRECETSRIIEMHLELTNALTEYKASRPYGQHVICRSETFEPISVNMAHDHLKRSLRNTDWERSLPSGRKKVVIGFHVFRHSFASNLAAQGVDQRVIDAWMGHQTAEMRKQYQHLFPESRHANIAKLSYEA